MKVALLLLMQSTMAEAAVVLVAAVGVTRLGVVAATSTTSTVVVASTPPPPLVKFSRRGILLIGASITTMRSTFQMTRSSLLPPVAKVMIPIGTLILVKYTGND
jgi:hypothetical protein